MKHTINSLCICFGFSKVNARYAVAMYEFGKLNNKETEVINKLISYPRNDRIFWYDSHESMNTLNYNITTALNKGE